MIPVFANWRLTLILVAEIALAIALAAWHWWLAFVAVPVIASRQYALAVLLHEAQHYLFCKSRLWNEIAGTMIAAILGSNITRSRKRHLQHHRYFGSPKLDPDRAIYHPICPGEGLLTRLEMPAAGAWLAQGAIFIVLTGAIGFWAYPILWALPLALAGMLDRFRISEEHQGSKMRTFNANLFERLFIAPLNMNYHAEHHTRPYVPWRWLPNERFKQAWKPERYFVP